jgi:thermostable 8-oxoguanine DNA glycosylase
MIDPTKITNYNLSNSELEKHLFFWVLAAGKKAKTASKNLDRLLLYLESLHRQIYRPLTSAYKSPSPFKLIRDLHLDLADLMKDFGIGCYNHKARTLIDLAHSFLDLKTCTIEDLEKIYGIGPKTARCFVMHTRKNVRYAGLDTHVLKYMRELGYDVPQHTPTGKKYLKIEQQFLELADKSGTSLAEFDLAIWNKYAK